MLEIKTIIELYKLIIEIYVQGIVPNIIYLKIDQVLRNTDRIYISLITEISGIYIILIVVIYNSLIII